ncbi:hypothetical protein [Sphaerimonospora thailandensis]|uniref:Uncharacterized protein n=1 Tax=Sphaerimonospora thailandensis TaxID=795644 RepID=A0A8J3RDZ7_9ACTN|nr:hypothetical protein [Sphaerimonospora thailandensis]GIH73064.1 hypothetical protein Mth01_53170 [Sphaerimonospora thailandensis]
MESMITFVTPWLASACPSAAVVAAAQTKQTKLRRGVAAFAQVGAVQTRTAAELRSATFGMARHDIEAYQVALVDRPMRDEQIDRTADGGAPGPLYAWREPVTR